MSIDTDTQRLVEQYLGREIDFTEFRREVLPIAWKTGEPGADRSPFARRVELNIAEYGQDQFSEDELREILYRQLPST